MAYHRGMGSLACVATLLALAGCTYNPFRIDNDLTGSATSTAVGAVAAGGIAGIAGATKTEIGVAALAGGLVGYYVSTLRFASGGILHGGGQVYSVGDYVTIEIPTDQLFDVNSADFLPSAGPILDSAVTVLERNPNNNIMISGNSSGFGSARFETKLTEDRARAVAAYLWAHGINDFGPQTTSRKLSYVGYGNYFPIANHIRAESIRQNSRIQITSYPSKEQLGIDKKSRLMNNIGSYDEPPLVSHNPGANTQPPPPPVALSDIPKSPPLYPDDGNTSPRAEPQSVKGEMWDDYNQVVSTPPPIDNLPPPNR